MKIYLPKILADSPTKLPPLEKIIFYYIVDAIFKSNDTDSRELNLEIDINELIGVIDNCELEFVDVKAQTKKAIDNLKRVKLSLIDNGFHIKLNPIKNVYVYSSILYVEPDPVIVEYMDQVLVGNYVMVDLLYNCVN